MKFQYFWLVLLQFVLFHLSVSCWDSKSTKYGDTTLDFAILVGSDLVINCTLKASIFPDLKKPVDSSYLSFKKDGINLDLSNFTRILNNLTAQLRIPNANASHSGLYHCTLELPNAKHVCSTDVSVGYPPKVTNFKCISRNFDNLTCTWDILPNEVQTNYSLHKVLLLQELQACPEPNNSTFCQWSEATDPVYQTMERNLTFVVCGNNSLNNIEKKFTVDHYAIVIPNIPEKLEAFSIDKQEITVQWKPPTMSHVLEKPELFYELRLQEVGPEPTDFMIIAAGVEKLNHTFKRLIPNYQYKVTVRCRSNYTDNDNMWSPPAWITLKTNPDVPYLVPQTNSEAFLVHNFGTYRNVTLYWKPIPKRHYNGENFFYHIVCLSEKAVTTSNVSSNDPHATIGYLENESVYRFHIHSANEKGISHIHQTLLIGKWKEVPPVPKDIRVISEEHGYYNLSWSAKDYPDEVKYAVFWCTGRKLALCDGPIHWSTGIAENKFSIKANGAKSNLQFAVSASYGRRASGMQWASCIVPRKDALGQIPITHIEASSTSLQVIWKLDCEAQKSVIDRYVITYCRDGQECKDAVVANPDVQSYTIKGLHPFTNYSVKLKAFNKDNKPSEDMNQLFKSTLSFVNTVLAMTIGGAIGGTLALAFFLVVVYRLVKWMSEKIHQVKNIAVRLPKELEGPESNPLHNYTGLKSGLVQTVVNDKSSHLYCTDENDNKNRHGSGNSQFSNSSTDELIFKNGKCAKFGRKPSGDSSGCSSISSNTTKRVHLSSDSGTESDFIIPASPDFALTEQSFILPSKQHMPILMEVHESKLFTNSNKNTSAQLDRQHSINGMVLKVDQSYSKFGVSGNGSTLPPHTNSLVFYSCHLANSEPSMFEAQASSTDVLPYSKIGLAKSSGDIKEMVRKNKDLAYSKFGLQENNVKKIKPFGNVSTVDRTAYTMEMSAKSNLGGKEQNLKSEGIHNSIPNKTPPSGYVQVGGINRTRVSENETKDADNFYSSLSSLEEDDDSSLQIPKDLQCGFSDLSDVTVWTTGVSSSNIELDHFNFNKSDAPVRTISSYYQNGVQTLCVAPSPSSGCLHIVTENSVNSSDNNNFNFLNAPDTDRTSPVILNQPGLDDKNPSPITVPVSGRNGYVPFSIVSSPVVDSPVPNSNSDKCSDLDQNYVTPSNKSELKHLHDGDYPSSKTFTTLLHCNGSKMKKLSDPLKYILKPLPKRESEICEV